MNGQDILKALNDIEPALVEDATAKSRKKRLWLASAACLVLLLAAGGLLLLQPWALHRQDLGGITRLYFDYAYSSTPAILRVFPWEYRTVYEKYPTVQLEGNEYRCRDSAISQGLLGAYLGQCEASGFDSDTTYHESFSAYEIRGVDPAFLLAVDMGEGYYVFSRYEVTFPATLGEFLDSLSLSDTFPLSRFSCLPKSRALQHYTLSAPGAPAELWELLEACREAPLAEFPYGSALDGICFTAASEALGGDKNTLSVSSNGYLSVNITGRPADYYIGPEKAKDILSLALSGSEATEPVPDYYTVCGTVTEIGDGYLLLDDDAVTLSWQSMTFRVSTEDLRIRRYLELDGFQEGDLVSVRYTGGIQNGTVLDAYRIDSYYFPSLIPQLRLLFLDLFTRLKALF